MATATFAGLDKAYEENAYGFFDEDPEKIAEWVRNTDENIARLEPLGPSEELDHWVQTKLELNDLFNRFRHMDRTQAELYVAKLEMDRLSAEIAQLSR